MAEIQKMFGVVHGMSTRSLFSFEMQHRVPRNPELAFELTCLLPGTTVGIEFHPDIVKPFTAADGHITSYANTSTAWYWEDIQKLCRERYLPVVFLDSPELNRQAHNRIAEAHDLVETIYDAKDFDDYWSKRRKSYAAGVKGNMINNVARERHMLERIAQTQPRVVILGSAHGDHFATRESIQRHAGMAVKRYMREEFSDELGRAHLTTYVPDDARVERRQLVRKYRAVSQGRVESSDRTPAYIGVFAHHNDWTPEEGLFEIYPDESGRFEGSIADLNGTALFQGEITPSGVTFMKEYETGDCLPYTTENTITYQGGASDHGYQGSWNAGGNFEGTFVLIPYSKHMDLRARKQFLDDSLRINHLPS